MLRSAVYVASALALGSHALTVEEATAVIHDHIKTYEYKGSMCTDVSCCTVSSTEKCSITAMPKDTTTMVLPGGNTRCIFSTSTPFAFQVVPGASDKVLVYFQGGGACWDETSTTGGFCSTDAVPQTLTGVFDRSNANNEYRDYTIIHISYCSGDLHGGDVVRPYNDSKGVPVTQRGYSNVVSVLDWISSQQSAGALSSTFSKLVVMGCSAGSIGAQLWGSEVVRRFKWQEAAVVPDSYAGVFPEGSQGPLIYDFGMCGVFKDMLSPALLQKCNAETMTLQDVVAEYLGKNPHIPFSFIQSKTDVVQMSFYSTVAYSMNMSASITPSQFYTDVNNIFGGYNKYSNFLTYLVNGDQHCFSPLSLYYTADTISSKDNGATSSQEMMYKWTNNFPLANGASETTACDGTVQATGSGTTYCSSSVVPKSFTETW